MSTSYPLEFNGWKVVSIGAHQATRGRGTVNFVRSSSLNVSKGTTDYKPQTANPQHIYTGPAIENTPILCFDDLKAALAWVGENKAQRPDYQGAVYTVHALARLLLPVTKVLDLKLGWADKAQAFWQAYVMGGNINRFETVAAPAHTIGVFGIVALGDRVVASR